MTDDSTPLNAHVTAREDLNDALLIMRVEFDDVGIPAFVPGQFTNLGLPALEGEKGSGKSGLIKRPYSVASAPSDSAVEFFVRLVDDGALTPKLWKLEPGDPVWMDERFLGKFTLEHLPETPPAEERDLVLISTGTGIAPFISMLRQHLDDGLWRQMVMINGVRIESDLGYRGELEQLAANSDRFHYIPVCSREEPSRWSGLHGRVDVALDPGRYADLTGVELTPEHSQVFLCGNPLMIDSVQALLESRDFTRHTRKNPGQIHLERYW